MTSFKTIAALGCLLFSSCMGLGPSTIKGDRNNYNVAIQKTNDEQLLLNLVRLKYRDTPLFLEITSVTSQFTFAANANANATLPDTGLNVFGLGAGAAVETNPVVTYSALKGKKFIRQFLSKIPLEAIYLLYKSGWSIERLLRLCVEKLGPLDNAPNASGPTPGIAPDYEKFLAAANMLRILQVENAVRVYLNIENGIYQLEIEISPAFKERIESKRLNALLGFPADNRRFLFAIDQRERNGKTLGIETRSLLGIMYYLSHGIDSPEEDIKNGNVTLTLDPMGNSFSWEKVTGDLLRIRSQSACPENASVSIPYMGHCYYIENSNLESKSTFSLLGQLFYLQAGTFEDTSPILTLPVGGR